MVSYPKKILFVLLLLTFLIPFVVRAIAIQNPLEWDTVEELIEGIIDFLFWIGLAIAPLMIIVAAFVLFTAAGDPSKVQRAKGIIFYTVIGFAVLVLAKAIVYAIQNIIGA